MSQTRAQLVGGVGFSTADSLTVHNGLAVTGVVTATSFSGNGAGLVGLANTDFINAEQVNVVGVVTATSFVGNGANLTGLANTDFINAEQVTVVGVVTASSAVLTGNISAASGTFTGNVTVGGTLTYDDVTNVDSIGIVTARTGVQFGLAGVGGSVSGTGNANFAGIVTATSLDASIAFWTLGASGTDHYTFTGPGDLSGDTDPDLQLIRGQKYIFKNRSGGHPFRIQSTPNGSSGTQYNDGVTNNDAGNGTDLIFDVPFDAPSILYYQCTSHGNMGGPIYIGSSSGDEVKLSGGVDFDDLLRESAKITAGKLSNNTNIDLENGMVHLFTQTETTTSTPNLRYNASTTLNSKMAIGEAISVTLITKAAAAAYSAQLTIDGSSVTENWTGGDTPSDGGSSGVDIHAYTIIKTADATFTVLATQTKTS